MRKLVMILAAAMAVTASGCAVAQKLARATGGGGKIVVKARFEDPAAKADDNLLFQEKFRIFSTARNINEMRTWAAMSVFSDGERLGALILQEDKPHLVPFRNYGFVGASYIIYPRLGLIEAGAMVANDARYEGGDSEAQSDFLAKTFNYKFVSQPPVATMVSYPVVDYQEYDARAYYVAETDSQRQEFAEIMNAFKGAKAEMARSGEEEFANCVKLREKLLTVASSKNPFTKLVAGGGLKIINDYDPAARCGTYGKMKDGSACLSRTVQNSAHYSAIMSMPKEKLGVIVATNSTYNRDKAAKLEQDAKAARAAEDIKRARETAAWEKREAEKERLRSLYLGAGARRTFEVLSSIISPGRELLREVAEIMKRAHGQMGAESGECVGKMKGLGAQFHCGSLSGSYPVGSLRYTAQAGQIIAVEGIVGSMKINLSSTYLTLATPGGEYSVQYTADDGDFFSSDGYRVNGIFVTAAKISADASGSVSKLLKGKGTKIHSQQTYDLVNAAWLTAQARGADAFQFSKAILFDPRQAAQMIEGGK